MATPGNEVEKLSASDYGYFEREVVARSSPSVPGAQQRMPSNVGAHLRTYCSQLLRLLRRRLRERVGLQDGQGEAVIGGQRLAAVI